MGKIKDYLELTKKYNTVVLENETLKNVIKDELYKEFMSKLGEPMEMTRLRNDNKQLRKKVKLLKEMISEGGKHK